jgi:hypothetical protein
MPGGGHPALDPAGATSWGRRAATYTNSAYGSACQPPAVSLAVAVALSMLTLFGIGAAKARLTHRPWLPSGLEIMGFGLVAAVVGYVIGRIVGEFVPGVGPLG